MGTYDALSDRDFELLVADLMTREYGIRFEVGSRGPDGGIDLLAALPTGGVHVVQCKHLVHSSMSELKRSARAEQAKLAVGIKPDRYSFVTSRRMTHAAKRDVHVILKPFTRGTGDVWGGEDLLLLLKKHPDVQRAHVKLWLSHAGTLERLLNSSTYERTSALLHEIGAGLPRYVQTDAFNRSLQMLHDQRVCIIAGPPGVGKTTTGHLLLLDCIEEGFTPFELARGVDEAWGVYQRDERQVFFFDDFLGRTELFETVSDDVRDLRRFLSVVSTTPGHRFILTTREYILRQAQVKSEELELWDFDARSCMVTVDEYSHRERALILYNHVYFSPFLDAQAREALIDDETYLEIISHPGYTPRLIEWLTFLRTPTDAQLAEYGQYCLQTMDHPEELWRHAFERGVDDMGRKVVLVLCSLPAWAPAEAISLAVVALSTEEADIVAIWRTVKILDGSFLRTRISPTRQPRISVINPSLVDYARRWLQSRPREQRWYLTHAIFFEQLAWIWDSAAHVVAIGDLADSITRTYGHSCSGTSTATFVVGSDKEWLAQLRQILAWCGARLELRDALREWLTLRIDEVCEGIRDTRAVTEEHMALVDAAVDAGLPAVDTLVSVIKTTLADRPYWGSHFSQMAHLRESCPCAVSDAEWRRLRAAFSRAFDSARSNASKALGEADIGEEEFYAAATRLRVEVTGHLVDHTSYIEDYFQSVDWGPDETAVGAELLRVDSEWMDAERAYVEDLFAGLRIEARRKAVERDPAAVAVPDQR